MPVNASQPGLRLQRYFSTPGVNPCDAVAWERRDVCIEGADGRPVFAQQNVEVPRFWSMQATQVVAAKYFREVGGQRETSVRQLLTRVVRSLTDWAARAKVFADASSQAIFYNELMHLLLHQMAAFNSPVWFNVGLHERPQCSACFIHGVRDELEDILALAAVEARLFRYGSGSGTNLSPVRGQHEPVAGGGTAAGPLRFMRGFDAFAAAIKSGGTTRRAAKMVVLDVDHPDIMDFIGCKAAEEKKAWALVAAGYDGSLDGEAYASVSHQNANHSVRVSAAFMAAVRQDGPWTLRRRVDGRPAGVVQARALWQHMAQSAHLCGDPGVQFADTINSWHTCGASGPIEASNPCSEYMFLNDSACNLASLNLRKFCAPGGTFDSAALAQAVRVLIVAQELIVDHAGYPSAKIADNSRRYRPLGLGYANLGASLMAQGWAYDSPAARAFAAQVTALMTGTAYAVSSELAQALGAFAGYADNASCMQAVLQRHAAAARALAPLPEDPGLQRATQQVWAQAIAEGERHGYRNAQVTVLAPTGTIAFMMDCDTTGIEPELALVKSKRLVGGGLMRLVNQSVGAALTRLGYADESRQAIVQHLQATGSLRGAPHLQAAHLPVFACSLAAAGADDSIGVGGHLQMMAAVQPFLSGAISKTVNLPASATVDDVAQVFAAAAALGLKAVAVYRDGCKRVQPLSLAPPTGAATAVADDVPRCAMCEHTMERVGPCFRCGNCGNTTACS